MDVHSRSLDGRGSRGSRGPFGPLWVQRRLVGALVLALSLCSLGLGVGPAASLAATSAAGVASSPAAYPDGTLVRGAKSGRVYAIYHGAAHWITTPIVLDLLGWTGAPVTTLPQATVNALPPGGPFVERILVNNLPNPFSPIRTVQANISTMPPSAAPGGTITVTGSGFRPGEAVQLNLADGALVAQTTAGATGAIQTALVIPAARPAGVYRLTALGLTTGSLAIEPIGIVAPTAQPSVLPSPSFTTAAGTFSVTGGGFEPGETIYLYVAKAYAVGSAANLSGAYGPVPLQVPAGVAVGAHTLYVFGARSHRLASGTILVAPPPPASVQVSPTNTSAGALETVSGASFVPGEGVALSIDNQPVGQATADNAGAFGGAVITVPSSVRVGQVALTARGLLSGRAISAVVTVVALNPHLLIAPARGGPGTAVTVAGTGYAAGETVTLSVNGTALATNPAAITTDAQGNFFASTTIPATVLSGPNAIAATGTRSRAAASALFDVRLPTAATWYFAGLDTRGNARATIGVLNPDNNPARLTLHIAFTDQPSRDETMTVAGHSRATIDMERMAGGHLLFVRLTADRRIAAAETTYHGAADWSGTPGVSAPARTWYLAEGYTGGLFHESLRIYNPYRSPVGLQILLLPRYGRVRTIGMTVGGDSGAEIAVNRYLRGQEVSAIVAAGAPVVVVRALTFGHGDFGATEDTGGTGAAAAWYFAEGATLHGVQTYYTILNPSRATPAAVTATFYNERGIALGTRTIIVAPRHRGTIAANGAVRSDGIAAVLTSNIPVVAERSIYYGAPTGHRAVGGSTVDGHNGGGLTWEFPEGNTGGGDVEFLLLQNPTGHAAAVAATFYTTSGSATRQDLIVPVHGRAVLVVNRVPGLPAGRHGALLVSTNGTPFIAEQSIYSADHRRGDTMAGIVQ